MSGSPVFDRLVAVRPEAIGATSTFLIFISDCGGYVGACTLLTWKIFSCNDQSMTSILSHFMFTVYVVAVGMLLCYGGAAFYFWRKLLVGRAQRRCWSDATLLQPRQRGPLAPSDSAAAGSPAA